MSRYFNDLCLKCFNRGFVPSRMCVADMPGGFDIEVGCSSFDEIPVAYEFEHGDMKFQHIGWNLFVNGKFHCGIGDEIRDEDDYVAIYQKYSKGC